VPLEREIGVLVAASRKTPVFKRVLLFVFGSAATVVGEATDASIPDLAEYQ
jgi:hypothetical protein